MCISCVSLYMPAHNVLVRSYVRSFNAKMYATKNRKQTQLFYYLLRFKISKTNANSTEVRLLL